MKHSVLPTLPHQRELCFSRNSVSKSNGQMTTPTISSVCGGSYPSVTKNSVIWSTCFNLQVPGSSFGYFLGSAARCWTSCCHRGSASTANCSQHPRSTCKTRTVSCLLLPICLFLKQFPFCEQSSKVDEKLAITTILRATALEGREHLASLRFTHTVPVSC